MPWQALWPAPPPGSTPPRGVPAPAAAEAAGSSRQRWAAGGGCETARFATITTLLQHLPPASHDPPTPHAPLTPHSHTPPSSSPPPPHRRQQRTVWVSRRLMSFSRSASPLFASRIRHTSSTFSASSCAARAVAPCASCSRACTQSQCMHACEGARRGGLEEGVRMGPGGAWQAYGLHQEGMPLASISCAVTACAPRRCST